MNMDYIDNDYIVKLNNYYVCRFDALYLDRIELSKMGALPMNKPNADKIARLIGGKVIDCKIQKE